MNLAQRLILVVGCTGILHTSMVPPAVQSPKGSCRYHEFTLRSLPFTRTFGIPGGDLTALFAEYGVTVAATGILFLLSGLAASGRREQE
jgi:hypothetical protein